jgi:hypothetical protein
LAQLISNPAGPGSHFHFFLHFLPARPSLAHSCGPAGLAPLFFLLRPHCVVAREA